MKAVIQAGGLGKRLSSITKNKFPKPMIKIGGKPLLEHLINNLVNSGIKDIFIIVGYLGDRITEHFKDGRKFNCHITYFRENPSCLLGTAGALFYLKNEIKDDFIFLLGDIFSNIDYQRMINFHYSNKSEVTLLVHPNSHPYDSDLVITSNNKVTGFDLKTNDRSNYYTQNLVNAGIMIFSKSVLKNINKSLNISYEKLIVFPSIKKNTCFAYKSSEYVKDIGTPERFFAVCDDYKLGIHKKRKLSNKQKCIFLDRDGTINNYVGFLKNIKDFTLINGASEAIKLINKSGYLAIIITNQPVVARGEITFDGLKEIHNKLDVLLGKNGAYVDDIYFCPHHPDSGFKDEVKSLKIKCRCRKPNVGLIEKAVKDYNIDLSSSYFIGDSTLDIKCAKNANIKSILVKTGEAGLDKKYDIKPNYIYDNILEAVKSILKIK